MDRWIVVTCMVYFQFEEFYFNESKHTEQNILHNLICKGVYLNKAMLVFITVVAINTVRRKYYGQLLLQ